MVYSKIRRVLLGTQAFLFYSTSRAEVDCDQFEALLQSGSKSISYRKAKKMHQRAHSVTVW